jgi:hypothetical protein
MGVTWRQKGRVVGLEVMVQLSGTSISVALFTHRGFHAELGAGSAV